MRAFIKVLLVAILIASPALSPAQPSSAAWTYSLTGESVMLDDCVICGRAPLIIPLRGTLQLRLIEHGSAFSTYAIESISLRAQTERRTYTITGKGTYRIGGDRTFMQEASFELEIGNGHSTNTCYLTNAPATPIRGWPMLRIGAAQSNGTLIQQYSIEIAAAPFQEIWLSTAKGFFAKPGDSATSWIGSGDILSHLGRVVRSNDELTSALGLPPGVSDAGIKDFDVLPGGDIAFSLENSQSSETAGPVSIGDLLSHSATPITVPYCNPLSPPLGWFTWGYGSPGANSNRAHIAMNALEDSGLKAAGYVYINIDDGAWLTARDANGNLQADPARFPGGDMKAFSDYVHHRGFKLGLYVQWPRGQAGPDNTPIIIGYERKDIHWMINYYNADHIKYDCTTANVDTLRWLCETTAAAVRETGRRIILKTSNGGLEGRFYDWMPDLLNLHCLGDVLAEACINWPQLSYKDRLYQSMLQYAKRGSLAGRAVRPGFYEDIGEAFTGTWKLFPEIMKTDMALKCLLSAPIILYWSTDPSDPSTPTVASIYGNSEAIAINKDKSAIQGWLVSSNAQAVTWIKPLGGSLGQDGWAVALVNENTNVSQSLTVLWSDIGLNPSSHYVVRDIWSKSNVATNTHSYKVTVPPYGTAFLRLTAVKGGGILKSWPELLAPFAVDPASVPHGLAALHIQDDGQILFSSQDRFFSRTLGTHIGPTDLLSDSGCVVASGSQLLSAFAPKDSVEDCGLAAVFVWPAPFQETWFSLRQGFYDTRSNYFAAGDLLSDRGYVVYRAAELLSAFAPPDPSPALPLDALFVVTESRSKGWARPLLDEPLRTNVPPDSLVLTWTSENRVFQLERSDPLTGHFLPLGPIGTGNRFTDSGALTNASGFYRVRSW